jgi:hypothetical protein
LNVGNNEERDALGRKGLRMQINEEGILEEEDEFVVMHSGGRYKRLKTEAKKGDLKNECEWRGPFPVVKII